MAALVDQGMREGALGLSSGLEYVVGSYATTDEMVALATAAAPQRGVYISHIRDEADRTIDAVRETIDIGERAGMPAQITHIKLGTVGVWGKAAEVVALVDAARARGVDVTADAYPYLAWQSNLKVLVPNKQYKDPASVKEALDDVGGGRNIQFTRLARYPQYQGKRLSDAAQAEGLSEVDFFIRIADDEVGIIGHTMSEPDLRAFYQQPWVMVASDGGVGNNHPRGAGTFPRVLGRLVREQRLDVAAGGDPQDDVAAGAAPRTYRPRPHRPGAKADLVLFDAATIIDRSTFEAPAGTVAGRARGVGQWRTRVAGRPGHGGAARPRAHEVMASASRKELEQPRTVPSSTLSPVPGSPVPDPDSRPPKEHCSDRPAYVPHRDHEEAARQGGAAAAHPHRQRRQRAGGQAARGGRRRLREHVLGRAAAGQRHGHDVDAVADSRLQQADARLHARGHHAGDQGRCLHLRLPERQRSAEGHADGARRLPADGRGTRSPTSARRSPTWTRAARSARC